MDRLIVCPGCGLDKFNDWLDVDGSYKIIKCRNCELGMMHLLSGDSEIVDYSDYGDHITKQDDSYFSSRLRMSFKKSLFFKAIKLFIDSKNAKILDFGGGAGFFAKSCENSGFLETYLVEPSSTFRSAAIDRVGLNKTRVHSSLKEISDINFDLVVMLDVIEHLPRELIVSILEEIFNSTKPGGYLLGFTPSSSSMNIKLHGASDPAIDPPRHVFYFNEKSIDQLLRNFGYTKVLSFTFGFKVNSFFRVMKSTPSWVERPTALQKPLASLIKVIFKLLSIPIGMFGFGYHVFFMYKRPVRN